MDWITGLLIRLCALLSAVMPQKDLKERTLWHFHRCVNLNVQKHGQGLLKAKVSFLLKKL